MKLSYYIDIFSDTIMPCFPLAIGFYHLKNVSKDAVRGLLFYLIVTIITFAISNVLANYEMNNLAIYNCFPIFELLLVVFIVHRELGIAFIKIGNSLFLLLFVFFLFKCYSNSILLKYIPSITLFSNLLIVLVCVLCIDRLLKHNTFYTSSYKFISLLIVAWLLFNAGTFMVQATYALNTLKGNDYNSKIWLAYDALLVLKYSIMAKALMKEKVPI